MIRRQWSFALALAMGVTAGALRTDAAGNEEGLPSCHDPVVLGELVTALEATVGSRIGGVTRIAAKPKEEPDETYRVCRAALMDAPGWYAVSYEIGWHDPARGQIYLSGDVE